MISFSQVAEILQKLEYRTDLRNPPDQPRLAQFKTGWLRAIEGDEYTSTTLADLTWNNCGFRFGKKLGKLDVSVIEEVFTILSKIYQVNSSTPAIAKRLVDSMATLESEDYFSPESIEDHRQRVSREVVQRRGQPAFRAALIEAYEGRCAITGCNALAALEAAHITAYLGEETNHTTNGLLLRADIHSLFDVQLLAIDPTSMKVSLSPHLNETTYSHLAGNELAQPIDSSLAPSRSALEQRWADRGWE